MMNVKKRSKRIALISFAVAVLLCLTGCVATSVMNTSETQKAESDALQSPADLDAALFGQEDLENTPQQTNTPDILQPAQTQSDEGPFRLRYMGINGHISLTEEQSNHIDNLIQGAELYESDFIHPQGAYCTAMFFDYLNEDGNVDRTVWLWSDGSIWVGRDTFADATELLTYTASLVKERIGIDPLEYDSSAIQNLESAELIFTEQNGDVVSQIITDPDVLAQIAVMFRNAQSIQGDSACPFDAQFTLTTQEGAVIEFLLATDSCDIVKTKSGVYLKYGDTNSRRVQFEGIFDEIPW